MKHKGIKTLIVGLTLLASLTACGDKEAENEAPKEDPTLEITDTSEDTDIEAQFEDREEIEEAVIQLETIEGKDFVYAHIKLSNDKYTEELASEYKNMLQEKYPDRILDLIISKGDELLFQETIK